MLFALGLIVASAYYWGPGLPGQSVQERPIDDFRLVTLEGDEFPDNPKFEGTVVASGYASVRTGVPIPCVEGEEKTVRVLSLEGPETITRVTCKEGDTKPGDLVSFVPINVQNQDFQLFLDEGNKINEYETPIVWIGCYDPHDPQGTISYDNFSIDDHYEGMLSLEETQALLQSNPENPVSVSMTMVPSAQSRKALRKTTTSCFSFFREIRVLES